MAKGTANGPNLLVLMNASIRENVVQSMSASIDLGSGCLYNDYDQLEHLSKTALLPAALLFKGNDKTAIIDQLWSEMKVSSIYDENDYYNTTYQYLTDDIEISITHRYYNGNIVQVVQSVFLPKSAVREFLQKEARRSI